jgi:hypothetical protein
MHARHMMSAASWSFLSSACNTSRFNGCSFSQIGHQAKGNRSSRGMSVSPCRRSTWGLGDLAFFELGAAWKGKATRGPSRMAFRMNCRCSPGSVHPLSVPKGPRSTTIIRCRARAINKRPRRFNTGATRHVLNRRQDDGDRPEPAHVRRRAGRSVFVDAPDGLAVGEHVESSSCHWPEEREAEARLRVSEDIKTVWLRTPRKPILETLREEAPPKVCQRR